MNGFYSMMNGMMNDRMPKPLVSSGRYRHGARSVSRPGARPVKRIIEPETVQKPEGGPARIEESGEYAGSSSSFIVDGQANRQPSGNYAPRQEMSPMDHNIKLDKESVITGIIFSEILGKPRALRKHRTFSRY